MNSQVRDIVDQIMEGPMICFTVFVEYGDGSNEFYTFSSEERQLEYCEHIKAINFLGQVSRIVLGESSLDCRGDDDWLFTIH